MMPETLHDRRVVAWFSAGATSAVAAKLAHKQYADIQEFHIVYCDPGSEHHDNRRFLRDVEEWIGWSIEILKSDKYWDVWDVCTKRRYLSGIKGALCTTELKKALRHKYQRVDDLQVFGFDADESKRAEMFRGNNHEITLLTPLIDKGLTKPDCMALLIREGLELPAMYRLGFPNANCVGCVKGGQAYWNHVREVFPEVFNKMARLERKLNVALNKTYAGDGQRKRVFLDELSPYAGRGKLIVLPECGLLCKEVELA